MVDDAAIFLAKAVESLRTAESEFANGRYNSYATRCYYASFQAAVAALLHEGIRPRGDWGHDFVQGQFVGQLINRRKRYSSDLRHVLAENQTLRKIADYRSRLVTQAQAGRALGRARMFVNAVEQQKDSTR